MDLARVLNSRVELCPGEVAYRLGDWLDIWPEAVRRDLDAQYHRERQTGMLPIPEQMVDASSPCTIRPNGDG